MCFSSITSLSIYFHLILMSNLVLIFLIAIFKIIFLIDFFFLQFHPSIFNLFNFYVEFNPNSFKFFCVVFFIDSFFNFIPQYLFDYESFFFVFFLFAFNRVTPVS